MWDLPGRVKIRNFRQIAAALIFVGIWAGCSPSEPPPTPIPTVAPATPTPIPTPSPASAETKAITPATFGLPSIADVADSVKPWVVSISTNSGGRFTASDEEGGTGFIIRPNGYVVTNYHVILGARRIQVALPSGETYNARVVGRDDLTDLAVLKINAEEELPVAKLGSSDRLRVGDWVFTIGNALALKGGPTVTLGIVSALGRNIETELGQFYSLIQTDAAINSGNSGGPLLNLNGEVVGVNQAIIRRAEGVGFAISASVAEPVIESLIKFGRVVRPRIGFNGDDVTPRIASMLDLRVSEGVIVTAMPKDGPAYLAGIRVGDVILKIDDIPTPTVAKWLTLLWSYSVGDMIRVEYMHNNEILTTTIELAERIS